MWFFFYSNYMHLVHQTTRYFIVHTHLTPNISKRNSYIHNFWEVIPRRQFSVDLGVKAFTESDKSCNLALPLGCANEEMREQKEMRCAIWNDFGVYLWSTIVEKKIELETVGDGRRYPAVLWEQNGKRCQNEKCQPFQPRPLRVHGLRAILICEIYTIANRFGVMGSGCRVHKHYLC